MGAARSIGVVLLGLGCLASPAGVTAQDQLLLGDVQVFGQGFLASRDPDLSSSVGLGPGSGFLVGQVQLDLTERLSFPRGHLYAVDSLYWWQGSDGGSLQNDLPQAYIAVNPTEAVTLVLGKQRLSWGTGYAFFPGDRMDPPVNPQKRSEGFYGVTTTIAPSASFTVTLSVRMDDALGSAVDLPGLPGPAASSLTLLPFLSPYLPSAPNPAWRGLRYALYVEAFLGDLDLHAATTYQYQKVLRPTAGFSVDVLGFILDGAVAVELSNPCRYPDAGGAYRSPDFLSPYPLVTLGVQRTAGSDTFSVTATLEYLYDSTGYDPTQAGRFYDELIPALAGNPASPGALLSSEASSAWFGSGEVIPALGQHYAAVSLTASANQLFSTLWAVVINVQDLSAAVQAEARLTRLEGVDLFVRGIAAGGLHTRSEFGSAPVSLAVAAGAAVHF